jgi:hypothetical protein
MTLLTRPAAYALGVSWDGEAMVRLEVGQAPLGLAKGGPCGQPVRGQGAMRYYDIG